ncbi:hypothetical protein BJF88_09795 [Cellulosimicrobium sp. CUA-896]|nr:hypothetical protein BJF88_09795 [Cellulosimicrobium sp. CUA-896]
MLGLALVAPFASAATATASPAPGTLPATTLAAAAPTTDGLQLWLPLDETAGTVAHDASGHGLDATLAGTGGGWREGQGLTFGGSNHVDLPDDLLAGTDAVTVSADVWVDPALSGNYFFYNLGNPAVGSPQSGNGYLFSTGNANYRATISDLAWGREQNTAKAPAGALQRGVWKTITYTLADGTARLYEDGSQVGQNTAVTITPGAIGGGTTTANALGKSAYAADGLFKGRMKDFRLYDRALTAQEVADLASDAADDAVRADAAALDLGDTSAVVTDLTLPAKGVGGSAVTWTTSDDGVVAADGTVTRPAAGEEPATATLTATVALRGASETRTVDVTVLPGDGDQAKAEAAVAAIEVPNLDDVRGNLTLPTTGLHGASLTWATSSGAITPTGEVTRPAHGEDAETVTLTATATVGGATATRELTAHVPPLPQDEELEGYLFSYFIGEGYADGEQVYFGLSQGNDALHYQNLNDNEPVLTSELGEKGLRDPFIIRSPEGDKFYQIATDLRIYDGNGWDAAQRQGSRSIMVWESTDLVTWTDQRLVEVSPETAGNTWAPEAYYDESIGAYVVFWASKLYAEDDPGHTGASYNRMMYATTRDFVTFSEAKVWVDPGYSVIDSTVAQDDDGTYYRFTKDERNNTSSTPCSKFILAEESEELLSTDWEYVTDCIGKANATGPGINQGEGPTIFRSNTEEKWYLFIDEFGGRGYVPFESDSLDAAEWTMSTDYEMPSRPRHGTVLPVTQAEYDRLLRTYQPDAFVESVEDVAVTVQTGSEPVLPDTVTARFADGSTGAADVTWDPVDPAAYAQAGTFEVGGTLDGGVSVRARAVVTVTDDAVPVEGLTVSPESVQVGVGGTRQLTATVTPANASARAITWASDDESVATVSADGVVSGVAAGHAMVTATTADGARTVYVAIEVTDEVPGLVVRYALDETSGTTAANSAPDATVGAATLTNGAAFTGTGEGVTLDGTNDYVDLPDDALAGLTDITVSLDVKIATDQATPYFVYGLGNSSGSAGNGYLFTTGNAYRTSIATGNWTTEQTVTKNADLQRGVWKHLTYTLEGTTAVLYEDGVEVGRQQNVTIDPQDIGGGSTLANYIGRSLYSGDRYLKGSVRDFRIYDRALTADEVFQLGADHTAVTGAELDALKAPAIVDGASSTVTLPVEPGTDLTVLAPVLAVSPRATVSPENGSAHDFTEPVEYTVTGPDGSSRTWTVRATEMNSPVLPGGTPTRTSRSSATRSTSTRPRTARPAGAARTSTSGRPRTSSTGSARPSRSSRSTARTGTSRGRPATRGRRRSSSGTGITTSTSPATTRRTTARRSASRWPTAPRARSPRSDGDDHQRRVDRVGPGHRPGRVPRPADRQVLAPVGQRRPVERPGHGRAHRRHDRDQAGDAAPHPGADGLPRGPVRQLPRRDLPPHVLDRRHRVAELPRGVRHRDEHGGPVDRPRRHPREGRVAGHPRDRAQLDPQRRRHGRLVHRVPPLRDPGRQRHQPRDDDRPPDVRRGRPHPEGHPDARERRPSRRRPAARGRAHRRGHPAVPRRQGLPRGPRDQRGRRARGRHARDAVR